MKQFFIIILFFFGISSVYSQNITFNNYYYPYYSVSNIYKLLLVNDNYYALIGQMTLNYKQNYGILKFDKFGNLIDSNLICVDNKYWGTDKMHGHGFIYTNDSCFLYCGGIKDTAGWVNGFLAKFDKNMDTLWTKQFYHPDTAASLQHPSTSVMHLSDIKETPDGNYIVTGNYNKNADGFENRSFLMKLDTAGNIIWHKLNPSIISTLEDIEIDPLDSGYFFPSAYNNIMIKLYKLDKNANIEWSIPINTMPYPNYPIDAVFVNPDTIIVASVFWRDVSRSERSVLVSSVNIRTQTLLWSKKFVFDATTRNITTKQSIGAHLTQKGNIIISATIVIPHSNDSRASLLLINQAGDSLWQRYYAHNWNDSNNVDMQLNDLLVCDDGGFLFGGFAGVHGTGFINSWLVKTDSLGMTQAAFTLGIEEENTLVIKKQKPLLYPNPATSNFNLRFEQSLTEAMQLSIYNSAGQLVKQEQLAAFSNEYRVDIGELSMGVYFVRLMSGEQILFNSKFIKQ